MRDPKRIILGMIFLVLVGGASLYAAMLALFAFTPLRSGSPDAVIVEIHKGQNQQEVSKMLASTGVIENADRFAMLGRITRQWKKIKAGEYKVSPGMTPMQILATLTSGISVAHPVTVREGENIFEIASDIQSKGLGSKEKFLELCRDQRFIGTLWIGLGSHGKAPATLEGYLFPDTYFFNRTLSPEDIIRQMLRRFFSVWGAAEEARAKELGLTRHQAVILASMIEKETGASNERPLISSVFHNRLKKKMRLQSDPTTIYGIWNRYDGNLHKSDLLSPTPYNTYTVPGLPAGPISNPGKEALHAALFPDTSPYLFFVSHNDGTHEFTSTIEDHMKAVRKFQLDPKAREGRSWRDLNKNLKNKTSASGPAAIQAQ